MKFFLKLLIWIGFDKILGNLTRDVLYSLLYELAKRVKDEDIEKLKKDAEKMIDTRLKGCLLYTSPSPRDLSTSRMPSSA